MSRERELLERAINEWDSDRDLYEFHKVMEEIRVYLAEPKVLFVRLTEEEVNSLTYAPLEPYELICAVENRLVEKNRG